MGTGKLFGRSLNGKYTLALNRLAQVKTPKIDAARSKREQGQRVPPRTQATRTPCSLLSEVAKEARKDCVSSRGSGRTDEDTSKRKEKKRRGQVADDKITQQDDDDNTSLIVAVGVSILLVGAGIAIHKRKAARSNRGGLKPTPDSSLGDLSCGDNRVASAKKGKLIQVILCRSPHQNLTKWLFGKYHTQALSKLPRTCATLRGRVRHLRLFVILQLRLYVELSRKTHYLRLVLYTMLL